MSEKTLFLIITHCMHKHTCVFINVHFNLSSSSDVKIPHYYETRTNIKKKMEDQEQHNERTRNDIDELKGGMTQIVEML